MGALISKKSTLCSFQRRNEHFPKDSGHDVIKQGGNRLWEDPLYRENCEPTYNNIGKKGVWLYVPPLAYELNEWGGVFWILTSISSLSKVGENVDFYWSGSKWMIRYIPSYLVLIFECHFEYGNDLGSKSISNICSNQKVLQMCRFFWVVWIF